MVGVDVEVGVVVMVDVEVGVVVEVVVGVEFGVVVVVEVEVMVVVVVIVVVGVEVEVEVWVSIQITDENPGGNMKTNVVAQTRRPGLPGCGEGFRLSAVATSARKLPNRIILHAKAGWGKTSWCAQVPGCIFLMVRDDGLLTLMNSGQLPNDIPHFPEVANTEVEVKLALNELIVGEHSYRNLVIDNLTGIKAAIDQRICDQKFKGDWGLFHSFGSENANKAAMPEWEPILELLDRLREKGMGIFLIAHSRVAKFNNPDGPDYDRWVPSLDKHSWDRLYSWSDMTLFGNFETYTDKVNKSKSDAESKAKASGGETRMLLTEWRATHDAKHRHGLPPEVECGNSPEEAWSNFMSALKGE